MSGGVPPGLAPLPGAWSGFFIAVAEVAATLAGLSFVAVSAHPPILRDAATRYGAQRALLTFVVVLVGALVLAMPQLPADATTMMLLLGSVAGSVLTIVSLVRESRSRTLREWHRSVLSLNSLEGQMAYSGAGI
jgi:hypothetical protein